MTTPDQRKVAVIRLAPVHKRRLIRQRGPTSRNAATTSDITHWVGFTLSAKAYQTKLEFRPRGRRLTGSTSFVGTNNVPCSRNIV